MKLRIENSILILLLVAFIAIPVQQSFNLLSNNNTTLIPEFEEDEESKTESEKETDIEIEKFKHYSQYLKGEFKQLKFQVSNYKSQLLFWNYTAKIHLPPPEEVS